MARGLRVCLAMSLLFLIIVIIVIVTLTLTIFKPKDPVISVQMVGFDHIQFSLLPNLMNVTLGVLITIGNPNYGSFKYIDSTGYVNYDDTVVAEIPIGSELVPARSKINVSTSSDFMIGKLIRDHKFLKDVIDHDGAFSLTSKAELPGKAIILKFIKLKATAYSSCDISVNMTGKNDDFKCISKIKM